MTLEPKRRLGYAALRVMEGHLKDREFFVGDRYSIADIALYAYTHVADEGGFVLGRFPSTNAWLERVAAQPGYVPITWGSSDGNGGASRTSGTIEVGTRAPPRACSPA